MPLIISKSKKNFLNNFRFKNIHSEEDKKQIKKELQPKLENVIKEMFQCSYSDLPNQSVVIII